MKKVFLLFLNVLLSLGLFSACNSSDEVDTLSSDNMVDLIPIDESNGLAEISDFFKTEFGTYDNKTKPFDFKKNLSNEETPCIIINSEKEFKKVYTGSNPLPAIDFSKYTLIIGKIYLPAGTFIDNMSIKQTNLVKATLYINCIVDTKGAYVARIGWEYYWKLFPKFNVSIINVEISKEHGIVDDSKKR